MILPRTKQAALAAAIEAAPRESCGLVVVVHGKERYWPCRNIAADDADFTICPGDYLAAVQAGSIVGVIHSHPKSFPQPTPADLASCEKWGVPWHVVSPHLDPPNGRWCTFEPTGYRAPLIGRKWVWGVHDCWSLVRDWYAEHGIQLRDFERPIDSNEFLKKPLFDSLFASAGFHEVSRDEILPGNVALMSLRSAGLNHVGVFTKDYRILHHVQGRLSCADVYGEGLQKSTGKIVRHLDYAKLKLA